MANEMINNEKKARFSPPAVGGVSLLVAFAVLCLTIFATLSLTTAQANTRLADSSAQAISNNYAADSSAQAILAQLRAGELPDGVESNGDIYTYSCPISSTQSLEVEVQLDGVSYTILRWQTVLTGDWTFDDSLDLAEMPLF